MFGGEQDTMHQANEFKTVDALLKSAAIYELANCNKKIIILVDDFFAH
jgi:acetylornithine deacetylase/succinyl-diaminopimelate desuccinylase-like protein